MCFLMGDLYSHDSTLNFARPLPDTSGPVQLFTYWIIHLRIIDHMYFRAFIW